MSFGNRSGFRTHRDSKVLDQTKKLFFLFDRRTKVQMAFLLVPITAVSVLEMASVGVLFPVLQVLTYPERLAAMPVVGDLYRGLTPGDPGHFLIIASIAVALFFLAKNVALLFLIYFQNRFVAGKLAAFMTDLFGFYMRRSYGFFLGRNTADFQRNVTYATTNAFYNGLLALLHLSLETATVAFICVLLLIIDPVPALLTAFLLGASTFLLHTKMAPHLADWGWQNNFLKKEMLQWISQSVGAIKETKILGNEDFYVARFGEESNKYTHYQSYAQSYSAVPRIFVESLIIVILFAAIAGFLMSQRDMGELVPMLGVYGAAALRVMPSLNRILQYAAQMKLAGSAVDIIYDDLSGLDEGAIEALHAHMTGAGGEATGTEPPPFPFAHEIRVQALDYDYPGAPAPTLTGIDFTIRKGESIGLVGASGSGKTTLADILLGLLPPTRGRVLVDDGDISDNLPGWRRRLGYVPQSIYLTDDTLGHNVALGVRDPDIDSGRVLGALHMAQLEDLVDSQPGKLETMIGERGIRLSGGQRQRIGIARALYLDPDILILDEATSSLDGATEQEISKAIESVSREKTLIVIAHRMNTVRKCGRLLFLKEGRLSAIGSYDDLMRDNVDFRKMVALSEESGEAP